MFAFVIFNFYQQIVENHILIIIYPAYLQENISATVTCSWFSLHFLFGGLSVNLSASSLLLFGDK